LLLSITRRKLTDMSIESLRQLPRSEKLKLMESLREELSRPDDQWESPAWDGKELAATEQRLAQGKEQILDWDKAKESFRSKLDEAKGSLETKSHR
jgi:hypothetical protein